MHAHARPRVPLLLALNASRERSLLGGVDRPAAHAAAERTHCSDDVLELGADPEIAFGKPMTVTYL